MYLKLLFDATVETIYMVAISGIFSVLAGVPLGMLLLMTKRAGIQPKPLFNRSMNMIVNIVRAIPFIILLVALIPLTRLIVGSSIGTTAAIVPLTIGAIPFVARIVENSLLEVGAGLIEAGQSMGASPIQIMTKVLFPEALPSIINGVTVTLITLVGYSAMAGAVGGGGLGSVAINYGYQRFNTGIILATIVILVLLVYALQLVGDRLAAKLKH